MATPAPTGRQERIALNEARFREINERLREGLARVPGGLEQVDYVCECGGRDCRDTVTLTAEEYEAVRATSKQFAVVPGHEIPDAERVVGGVECYTVVEKFEAVADIVAARDPRA